MNPAISNAAETGISGTVLWGPVAPGPARVGQSDEAPLSAYFLVYDGQQIVDRFRSGDDGSFDVSLPPGDYTIVPDKKTPIPFPQQQKTQVTVPKDGITTITIRLDTGMK